MNKELNPMEVAKSMEKFEHMIRELKYTFEAIDIAEKEGISYPFATVTYAEVVELSEELITHLREHEQFLNDMRNGFIMLNTGEEAITMKSSNSLTGENAPAYKRNIDEKLMYQLFKERVSINEIARRVGCSPDTVKRRIYKMKQDEKGGRKI